MYTAHWLTVLSHAGRIFLAVGRVNVDKENIDKARDLLEQAVNFARVTHDYVTVVKALTYQAMPR